MTAEELHGLILSFPATEPGTTHGWPSYKAAGKFLTRLRAEDDSVVVYVDGPDHRDMLMEAEPETFHITDHYRGHPIVLARLSSVDPDWLRARMEARWRKLVPKSLSWTIPRCPDGLAVPIGRPISGLPRTVAGARAMTEQLSITVDGLTLPLLGFGTWQLEPADARRMVAEALRIGYRHIDTAWIYRNEAAVGDGIRDAIEAGHVAREDLWLTTKIWVEHFHRDALLKQAEESAASLGFTPDLLLLHWPKPQPTFEETLGALNEAKDKGLTRAIGLSNFPSAEWRRAQAASPARLITNQVEHHPYLSINALKATATELGSSITAWSPLAQGKIADDPVIADIARVHGKTNGQVALRWIVQQGIVAIPRTAKASRAEENFDIWDISLSGDEMDRIHAQARPDGRLGPWLDSAFEWDKD